MVKDYNKLYNKITLQMEQDINEVVERSETDLKSTLEARLLSENIPLKAQEFYCKYTGRHKELGIPYSSPP